MSELHLKKCEPCDSSAEPLPLGQQQELISHLSEGWKIVQNPSRLQLVVTTSNFSDSLEMAQIIGKMADEQWHHPEILVAFKKIQVEIFTHVINGLREADFIFAAKVDHLLGLARRSHS